MPTIIRWPAKLTPGTTDNTPLSTLDILPTLCEITGTTLPADRPLDGCSFLNRLAGEPYERTKPLFYMNPLYAAVREGDWKLVMSYESAADHDSMLAYFRNRTFRGLDARGKYTPQLFDLKSDRSEKNNLVFKHPDVAKRLFEKLTAISRDVQIDMPDQPGANFIPPKLYRQIAETNPDMPIPKGYYSSNKGWSGSPPERK